MRTPDWKLERIALGELPADELERARAQLLSEPDGAERLASLQRENAELLRSLPPERVSAEVSRRRTRKERPRAKARWMFAAGLPLAAALALLLVLVNAGNEPPAELDRSGGTGGNLALLEGTRLKGGRPSLVLHRRESEGGGARALSSGDTAREGDELQVGYVRAGRTHGVIVSIDGRGAVTLHLPEQGPQSAALEGTSTVALPHAYALDDAPHFERFFFVTSSAPFPVQRVLDAAEGLAAGGGREGALQLDGEPALEQSDFLLLKPSRGEGVQP